MSASTTTTTANVNGPDDKRKATWRRKQERLIRGLLRIVTALASAVLTLVFASPAVEAHSFLVRTSPQPGARLTGAPDEIVLDFTDPVAIESNLVLRDENGVKVTLLSMGLDNNRTRLRASLPLLSDGVYQVTWKALAEDAHTTEGEFVFAVGVDLPAGAVVTSGSTSGSVQWTDAVVTLALLAGIAIALGGLLSERFVWPRDRPSPRSALITESIAVALGGAVGGAAVVLRRAGLLAQPAKWFDAFSTRADRLVLAVTVVLAVALLLVQRMRTRAVGLVLVVVAGVLVALRGHGPEGTGWWSSPAAAAHLLIGGAWVGALIHLTFIARANSGATETSIEPGPSRYAAAALVAVLATLIVGPVIAFGQLQHFKDLTDTGYGQILLVKLVLVGLGLAVAGLARRRGIPATGERIRLLARYTTIEALLLMGVLATSALLSTTAPTRGRGFVELGPVPLPKPTTLTSDLAGSHQVLVAAAADRLQIMVLPPGGQPTRAQSATFEGLEPDGKSFDLKPRSCGPGCYDIAHEWANGITTLTATVTDPDADGGSVRIHVAWPPGPDATDLLAKAIAATAAAAHVTVTESVSSGPANTTGPGDLTVSGADYIDASPFKAGADDVHQQSDDGGLRVITFAVSGTGTWHELWIDDTNRIRRETLVDPGHRIDRNITYQGTP